MKRKSLIAAVLALALLLALTACGKTQSVEHTDAPAEQISQTNPEVSPSTEETSTNAGRYDRRNGCRCINS